MIADAVCNLSRLVIKGAAGTPTCRVVECVYFTMSVLSNKIPRN